MTIVITSLLVERVSLRESLIESLYRVWIAQTKHLTGCRSKLNFVTFLRKFASFELVAMASYHSLP